MARSNASPPPAPTDEQKKIDPTLSPVGTDAAAQKRFILSDPLRYLGILSNTVFIHNRGVYLDSFVGRFGWMNKHLPAWHIDLYLLALLLTALLSSVPGIKTGIKDRLLPLALFSSGIAIVETGMYLYWTGTGKEYVFGVQGRYFIPYAPLFFLFLYNQTAEKILRRMLPSGDAKPVKAKGRAVVKSAAAAGGAGPEAANNFGYCLLVCFSIISLISAVYAALSSNYRILL